MMLSYFHWRHFNDKIKQRTIHDQNDDSVSHTSQRKWDLVYLCQSVTSVPSAIIIQLNVLCGWKCCWEQRLAAITFGTAPKSNSTRVIDPSTDTSTNFIRLKSSDTVNWRSTLLSTPPMTLIPIFWKWAFWPLLQPSLSRLWEVGLHFFQRLLGQDQTESHSAPLVLLVSSLLPTF